MSYTTEQFLEYNKNNIYANLLQAEDHISSTIRCDSCVNKHLVTAWGEALEAAKSHCKTPEECEAFDEIAQRIYELVGRERREGCKSVQSDVKAIRKDFENEILNYNGCKDGICLVNLGGKQEDREGNKQEEDINNPHCYLDENFNLICEKFGVARSRQ